MRGAPTQERRRIYALNTLNNISRKSCLRGGGGLGDAIWLIGYFFLMRDMIRAVEMMGIIQPKRTTRGDTGCRDDGHHPPITDGEVAKTN